MFGSVCFFVLFYLLEKVVHLNDNNTVSLRMTREKKGFIKLVTAGDNSRSLKIGN